MANKKKKRRVNWSRIIIAGVIMLMTWSLLITGCVKMVSFFQKKEEGYTENDFVKSSNGFLKMTKEGYEGITGVDVSSYQGDINWYSVKNAGVDFAMIRVGFRDGTTGKLYEDPLAYKNIENATKEGIKVGLYFYSSAINDEELQEEIDFVLDMAKEYKITYPIAYDMEPFTDGTGRITDLSASTKTELALKFCEAIEKAGYKPMVYGNQHWFEKNVVFDDLKKYSIWYAGYDDKPAMQYAFDMWQYTDSGEVAGIEGNVDLNIFIKEN